MNFSKNVWLVFTCLIAQPLFAAEWFVTAGAHTSEAVPSTGNSEVDSKSVTDTAHSFVAGIRRELGENSVHRFGFALEHSAVNGHELLALRALDYQRMLGERWRIGGFVGAAKVESGAAQTGYYLGLNLQRDRLVGPFDAVAELRYGDALARDRLETDDEADPDYTRPDIFLNFTGLMLGLNYRF